MPTNTAAQIGAKYARLELAPAPYTAAGDDQIVVRNAAVAINPLDWIIQVAGPVAYRWLTYPTVLGSDRCSPAGGSGSASFPAGPPGCPAAGRMSAVSARSTASMSPRPSPTTPPS